MNLKEEETCKNHFCSHKEFLNLPIVLNQVQISFSYQKFRFHFLCFQTIISGSSNKTCKNHTQNKNVLLLFVEVLQISAKGLNLRSIEV